MKHELPESFATIVEKTSPEKIFLLSTYTHHYSSSNIFVNDTITVEKPAEYCLLALAAENEQRTNDMLQQIIENNCSAENNITAFVLPVHQFNKWLMQVHPFACKVYHNAQLCYNAGRVPLAIPDDCDITYIQQKLQLALTKA
jgi:hypothetical protein